MLWTEVVHICERMGNSMATTNSMKIPFQIFYGEKPKTAG